MRISLNAPQTRFIEAVDDNRFVLFGAGVGTGKTTLIALMVVILVKKNPGLPGLLASHLYNHLKVELLPQVLKNLKAARMLKHHRKADKVIECRCGASIQYGSADNDTSLEGRNVAWGLGDELRFWPKTSWDRFVARVRIKEAPCPRVLGGSTLETNWLEDEWRDKPRRMVVHASTYENEENLREGYIDDLADTLSPHQFEQYVMAKWVAGSATVYGEEYSPDLHITDCWIDPNAPVDMGLDPGINTPAVVFYQRHRYCPQHGFQDCVHVLDELVPDGVPLTRLIPMMRAVATRHGWRLGKIWVDPFGGNQRENVYGETAVTKLQEEGFEVDWSYEKDITNILNGIAVVQSRLMNVAGEARLYFDRRMQREGITSRNALKAMQSYRWPERKAGQAAKSNPLHDETSHIMDALRYPLVNMFPPIVSRAKTF